MEYNIEDFFFRNLSENFQVFIKMGLEWRVIYMNIYVHLHEDLCTFTWRPMLLLHEDLCTFTWRHVHLHEDLCTFTWRPMYFYMKTYVHLHEDLCTFTWRPMYIYLAEFFLEWGDQSFRENQKTRFIFSKFSFWKSCRLWDNVEIYCTAGQTSGPLGADAPKTNNVVTNFNISPCIFQFNNW